MKVNFLKERWDQDSVITKRKEEILDVFKHGGKITNSLSPFDIIDNLADFRGLDLSDIKITNVEIRKANLSHCILQNVWMENSSFENVLIEKTDCTHLRDRGNEFTNVTFDNCTYIHSAIGYKGSKYRSCQFNKTNFSKAIFIRAEFDNCVFKDCKLKGIDFDASSFKNVTFIGKLDDVWFRGGYALESFVDDFGEARPNTMDNVSFENAELLGLTFSNNCDLSSVKLPTMGNYRLYSDWHRKLENLKKAIKGWPSSLQQEATYFVDAHLVHAKKQDWHILNFDEMNKEFGEEVSKKIFLHLNSLLNNANRYIN